MSSSSHLIGLCKTCKKMEKRDKLGIYVFWKMEQSIRENGLLKKIRRTVEAYKFGQMGLDMMDFGKTVWPMVMGD